MRYRHIGFVGMLLSVTAAQAQSAPPPPPSTLSDSWSTPAPAHSGSAAYRSAPSLGGSSANAATHFQFKSRQPAVPADPAPGDGTNKVPIFGTNQVGADGRPPVNCPQNPRDPACR